MIEFKAPLGTNFRSNRAVAIAVLAKALCRVASFLQGRDPYRTLVQYHDWWEHDGLHFRQGTINFDGLFAIVSSPRALQTAMPGDDDVRVGIAPPDCSWYLRFYVEWDEDGFTLTGHFDITLPDAEASDFRQGVSPRIGLDLLEQDAQSYYHSIRL